MTSARPDQAFAAIPDPGRACTLDELIEALRSLKVWAGDPSYEWITGRVNKAWTAAGRPASELTKKPTVVDCFKPGRRRLSADLVIAIVQALHPDVGYMTQWRQSLRVIGGESRAASQVRTQDTLPADLAGFTGRTIELDRLRQAVRQQADGGAVVISAIEGMAGVGKTQLAIHAGHLLTREMAFDRVLFVNLRGFHPDPAQPPADPAAVLDGFLRLLGVPGQQIPHDLDARVSTYRRLLAGIRALVVLDNAADADQVRPLLPRTPGCLALVTSRCNLADLNPATQLAVDVFTEDEALTFLARAAPHVPVGEDPGAAVRITARCGCLPLALGLVAGHIRAKPDWTLTDHADWLDERHHARRLDRGVELAFDLSYQHLPADRQRLLRLLALHPGQDFDVYAAAALADTDQAGAQARLDYLRGDHLLQQGAPGRYALHDLIRAYATTRAHDEDRQPERHAALTRLFDYYLAATSTAMETLHPAEAHLRPSIPPASTPAPDLTDPDTALAWLDTERPTLVSVSGHTATHGWPTYATRLSMTLRRYLAGGHHTDAVSIHSHAHRAARESRDWGSECHALHGLGAAHSQLGEYGSAIDYLQQALTLYRRDGNRGGEARALNELGVVHEAQGRYEQASEHYSHALTLHRRGCDPGGQARALANLGLVNWRQGRYEEATSYLQQAIALTRQVGDRYGEAVAVTNLGLVKQRLGLYEQAADHHDHALTLYRQLGHRQGEAEVLDNLGMAYNHLDMPELAADYHQQALRLFSMSGDRDSQAWSLNGLGEAAHAAGHFADALTHHNAAITPATETGSRDQLARAHAGLGRAHASLGQPDAARQHYLQALTLYTNLGMPQADQVRAHLTALEGTGLSGRRGVQAG